MLSSQPLKRKASVLTEIAPDPRKQRSTTNVQVAIDPLNIYVYRGGRLLSSDVGHRVVFEQDNLPPVVVKFLVVNGNYYLLDGERQLWCNRILVAVNVVDFNDHYVLLATGVVGRLAKPGVPIQPVPLIVPVHALADDLFIGRNGCLYDSAGVYIASDVAEAHTDGDDIAIRYKDGRLELITDHTENLALLATLLTMRNAVKIVTSDGSLLIQTSDGGLFMAGRNHAFESGDTFGRVDWVHRLPFPRKVADFDFKYRAGWARLEDDSIWVWGDNENILRFLQWHKEFCVSPRPLVL